MLTANLYYDLRSDSKFTPALGIGVGFAKASLAYRTLWHRTNDPENITVFDTEALTRSRPGRVASPGWNKKCSIGSLPVRARGPTSPVSS